jgi:arabinose-5-phosphate isomerase
MEFKRILEHEVQQMTSFIERLDQTEIEVFVSRLVSITGKLVIIGVGKSGLVGQKIAATLASTGTPSFFVHPSEAFHGDLGMLSANDGVILLSNSGESGEVVQLLPYLSSKVDKVFAISKNPNSSLARGADHHLEVRVEEEGCPLNLAPMSSTTLLMAVGDAIAGELIVRKSLTEVDFASNHPGGAIGRKLYTTIESILKPWIIKSEEVEFAEVISFMIENKASAVIIEYSKGYKLITDGDIRRAIQNKNLTDHIKIGTTSPITIKADSALIGLKQRMIEADISHMVVVNNELPLGIINKSDLF